MTNWIAQVEDAEAHIVLKSFDKNDRKETDAPSDAQEDSFIDVELTEESAHFLVCNSNANCTGPDACEHGQSEARNVTLQTIATPTRVSTIRKLVLPVYLNCLITQSTRALVLAALPLHILDLGGDSSDVGAIASAYGFGYVIINLPGGWLLSQLGPKPVFLISCALYIISSAIAMLAELVSLVMLTLGVSSFVLGAANSLGILAWQTFVGAQVVQEHRGLAMSTLGGVSRAGYTIGPFLGGILSVAYGTTSVFILQIILSLVAFVAGVAFMPSHTSEGSDSQAKGAGCQTALDVFRENCTVILRILGFLLTLQTVRKARELFFALAGRDIGLSADLVGHLTALSYFFDMACFPIAGRIMDTCGRKVAGVLSLMTQSLGVFVLLNRTTMAVFLFAILTGVGNGLSSGIVMTIGSDLSPQGNARGPFLAVYRTLVNSTELLAPAVIGFVARYTSLPTAELSASVFGLLGILWVIACMPETLPRDKRTFNFACCSTWSSLPSHPEPEERLPGEPVGRECDSS